MKRNIQTPLTVDHGVDTDDLAGLVPGRKASGLSSCTGLYEKDSNGASDPKLLRELGHSVYPMDWSRDGKFLLYDDPKGAGGSDMFALPLQGGGEPKGILTTPAEEGMARLSPDGRWIAYISNKSGGFEVYIQPFDDSRLRSRAAWRGNANLSRRRRVSPVEFGREGTILQKLSQLSPSWP